MKYPFIEQERTNYTVQLLCHALDVAPSGYYAWRRHKQAPRTRNNLRLLVHIKAIHGASRSTYGSPRVYHELRSDGQSCSENRVARIMRDNGLRARTRKKYKITTDSNHPMPVAPNLLDRTFDVPTPNTVWTSDISFVWTREGWLYLAIVLDLYSRKIVGWSMGKRMQRGLVIQALEMAVRARKPAPGLLLHSDQGSQYASRDYQAYLTKHGIVCSMSRRGNCWDNAPAESFFSTIKRERIHHKTYQTRAEAYSDIFQYIEGWYNPHRIHSTLGYKSPAQFEHQAITFRKVA